MVYLNHFELWRGKKYNRYYRKTTNFAGEQCKDHFCFITMCKAAYKKLASNFDGLHGFLLISWTIPLLSHFYPLLALLLVSPGGFFNQQRQTCLHMPLAAFQSLATC
jgi:hypothetical protein